MFPAAENASDVSTRAESAQDATTQTSFTVDLQAPGYCVFGSIFLFSVTGNTLVMLTVLLLRKMKTVPMIFIANLAACDLTTTVSSIAFDLPMEELGYWPYGPVLCKIIYPLATFSTNAAALTLVAISIDRYISIICPLNLQYRITRGRCLKMILAIYCISALAVVPYAVFLSLLEDEVGPHCAENWPEGYNLAKIYTVFLFVLQYGLPLLIMSVIYTLIGLKLCKNTGKAAALSSGQSRYNRPAGHKLEHSASAAMEIALLKRKRQNEKTAKMFLFVVVIFLIFMMPHQLLWLSYDYFSHTQAFKVNEAVIVFVCRAFTYANSVLNAIIYGVCNGNFRRGCLSIIKCQCSKASQRSQEQRKRTESMHVAKQRHLPRHNSSCRSTTTIDSVSMPIKESRGHNSPSIEAFQNKTTANEIKNSVPRSSNGDATAPLIRKSKVREVTEINGNCLYMNKPPRSALIKPDAYRSLYENTSSGDLFQRAMINDTAHWLSETEALLNRLCMELDTTGEKGWLFEQQQEISPTKKKRNYTPSIQECGEKETIL